MRPKAQISPFTCSLQARVFLSYLRSAHFTLGLFFAGYSTEELGSYRDLQRFQNIYFILGFNWSVVYFLHGSFATLILFGSAVRVQDFGDLGSVSAGQVNSPYLE
ncbi:hypothetical protein GOP47_0002096 [Adiantum capillus-veneris]|uniref:Uncharacterized protein n=1 Tax=Adiantum capillus-veneris TaxID=13818 RepID=A0A9D4VB20_ADICA|nr:hypothetical protein GOP47_0002096 [Adiantum capillus-veneris]